MAEAVMLVCDVFGKPEATTVTFRVGGRNLQKDFCSKHLAELVEGARAPKRGRRPGSVMTTRTTSNAASRRKPAARKAAARKTPARRKTTARQKRTGKKTNT